ncbi:unnamed protein product [Leuciscus chuanchicus]
MLSLQPPPSSPSTTKMGLFLHLPNISMLGPPLHPPHHLQTGSPLYLEDARMSSPPSTPPPPDGPLPYFAGEVLAHLSVEFKGHHSPGAEKVGHPHPDLEVLAHLSVEFKGHHSPGAEKVGHPHPDLGVLLHLSVEFEGHHSPGAEKVGHPHPDLGVLAHLSVEFEGHHSPREAYSPCLKLVQYQKSVLGKLVEILDEIKRVGRHYEPLNSAVHVARLETLEEFAQEEAHLKDRNLWEQRVSQLSKVGGRNDKDCVHKVMDRY